MQRVRGVYHHTMVKDQIALGKLQRRMKNPPKQINNSALHAGSAMYFYCVICGWLSDELPESYTCSPKKYCGPCRELKEANPEITNSTLRELGGKLDG